MSTTTDEEILKFSRLNVESASLPFFALGLRSHEIFQQFLVLVNNRLFNSRFLVAKYLVGIVRRPSSIMKEEWQPGDIQDHWSGQIVELNASTYETLLTESAATHLLTFEGSYPGALVKPKISGRMEEPEIVPIQKLTLASILSEPRSAEGRLDSLLLRVLAKFLATNPPNPSLIYCSDRSIRFLRLLVSATAMMGRRNVPPCRHWTGPLLRLLYDNQGKGWFRFSDLKINSAPHSKSRVPVGTCYQQRFTWVFIDARKALARVPWLLGERNVASTLEDHDNPKRTKDHIKGGGCTKTLSSRPEKPLQEHLAARNFIKGRGAKSSYAVKRSQFAVSLTMCSEDRANRQCKKLDSTLLRKLRH
ncbi:hypothetical protein B0H34DRAFT_809498 [Crassisporium funariophilum]|nr:hypothetical protein B0H34DRAFT_809498 [Crassisporium funariophilum]